MFKNDMKKFMFLRFLFFTLFYSFSCFSLTLEKMNVELSYPWGMTWIDSTNLLITEKKSLVLLINPPSILVIKSFTLKSDL